MESLKHLLVDVAPADDVISLPGLPSVAPARARRAPGFCREAQTSATSGRIGRPRLSPAKLILPSRVAVHRGIAGVHYQLRRRTLGRARQVDAVRRQTCTWPAR